METALFAAQQTVEKQVMKVDLWPVDGSMPPATSPRWRRFIENYLPKVVIYLMVATLVAIVLYPHMVVTVPSGEIGVLWKRFGGGTVLDPRKLRVRVSISFCPGTEYFCTTSGCNPLPSLTTPSPATA